MTTTTALVTLRPDTLLGGEVARSLFIEGRPDLALLASISPEIVDLQWRGWCRSLTTTWAVAEASIIEVGGRPAGRIIIGPGVGVLWVVDIAVLAAERGQGVATQVLGSLLDRAGAEHLAVRLHVAAGNPARRLYERLGFEALGDDGMHTLMERRSR